jgi:hypothetical protein
MHDKNVKLFQDNEYLCHFKQPRGAYPTYDTYFFNATRVGYLPKSSTNLLSIPTISKINQKKNIKPHIDAGLISYCHHGIAVINHINGTKV